MMNFFGEAPLAPLFPLNFLWHSLIFTSVSSTRSHKLIKKFDPFNPKLFKRVTLAQTCAGKWFHVNDSPCQDDLLLKRAVFVIAKSPVPISAFRRE